MLYSIGDRAPLTIGICALVIWLGACATPGSVLPASRPPLNAASTEPPALLGSASADKEGEPTDVTPPTPQDSRPTEGKQDPVPEEGSAFHVLATVGVQGGGDSLVEHSDLSGRKYRIQAGEALTAAAGGMLEPFGGETHVLQLQATVGYHYRGLFLDGSTTSTWTHWPLELLAFYANRPSGLRVGGGLQYQLGVSLLTWSEFGPAMVSLDNALGLVLQADYQFLDNLSVYLRYTLINYRLDWEPEPISGSGVGMGLRFSLKVL